MLTYPVLTLTLTFLFGITIGSFLNVCIYRIPEGQDIVRGSSHCMSCGYHLKWFDLIPVFSWLFLGGRCRKCGAKISIQYPFIELLNGLAWTGLIAVKGLTVTGLCCCIAFSALLVLSVIDWRTFEIPLGCNLVIFAAGAVNLVFHAWQWPLYLTGLASVSFLLYIILILSGGRAMGGGDVKLMAAAGLLLGWKECLLAFAVGCISGSILHLLRMRLSGKEHMLAFGPYLSLGIWFAMMWGEPLICWYTSQLPL